MIHKSQNEIHFWLFSYGMKIFPLKKKVWLPPNVTWKSIEPGSRDDIVYADYRHLLWPIPMSFILIALRFLVEK